MDSNHRCGDKFDRLEEKIEGLDYRMDLKMEKIETILTSQHESLSEHMRRTSLLEQEILPIKAFQNQLIGIGKFLGAVGILSSMIATILKVFGK